MALFLAVAVAAQDPAHGWMAYAVGTMPSEHERITRLEMTWTVGKEPSHSRAFFSPWFGMDPADNLNLVQPVNPWMGNGWSMYTEYFQWSPEHNSNSKSYDVAAGSTLHGAVVYQPESDSYLLTQTAVETGDVSSQVVPCQSGKKFTVPYGAAPAHTNTHLSPPLFSLSHTHTISHFWLLSLDVYAQSSTRRPSRAATIHRTASSPSETLPSSAMGRRART